MAQHIEMYLEPCQSSQKKLFAVIVNDYKVITTFEESFKLDLLHVPKYP